ncbi:MAG: trypsin-like peptidase domain-containing protein [Myxococcales bacterium]|nr:trypsin-like peptidase domain-containing protein [Myxococcales bacterium]
MTAPRDPHADDADDADATPAADAATPTPAAATPAPTAPAPAPAPGADDDSDDPSASGSMSAIEEPSLAGRAWRRAQTIGPAVADVTRQVASALGPASPYHRHDFIVIALALGVVAAGGYAHRRMIEPTIETFQSRGLTFTRPATWLAPEEVDPVAPRLVPARTLRPRVPGELPYHVVYTSSLDPDVRMEVRIEAPPPWSNVIASLEFDRRTRWGELYAADRSQVRTHGRHSWLRTSFRFAFAPNKGDEPRVGHAIELATVDRERLYAVTLYGSARAVAKLAAAIEPTLRVSSLTGKPLLSTSARLQAPLPAPVQAAIDRTVMVMVADVVDGELRAVGGGSGAIIGADGSVLTAHHLLVDNLRPHAVFVIARAHGADRPPEMVCAGSPSRSKLWPEMDLALVKCDVDLDGRPWTPAQSAAWPAFARRPEADLQPGQRLWVMGFPDVNAGAFAVSPGAVQGLATDPASPTGNYVKTDAVITLGNSGGPVVDETGALIGIASAVRVTTSISGSSLSTTTSGLVRPIGAAGPLLAIVRAGWVPRDGHTSIDLEPTAIEAEAEGVRLSTRIVGNANGQPIAGALLMIMRAGVSAGDVDINRLDDQVISWGRSGTDGAVYLKQPVPAPGTYTVMVTADGYSPLIGDGALRLDAGTPAYFDPWGEVRLGAQ